MTEIWKTPAEWAADNLPGLPSTAQGITLRAKKAAWHSRPRQASGGGREYPLSALPTAARAAYVARHLRALDVPLEVAKAAASEPEAEQASACALDQRDGRLAILAVVDDFASAAGIGRKRADALFCAAYAAGAVEVAPWVREAVKSVTPRTLARWRAVKAAGTTHRLAVDRGAARRGKGVLEIANTGDVKVFCLALLSRNPLFTADHVRDLVGGQFGPTLEVRGQSVPLPPLRTFQEALKAWKTTHKVELTALTNPDAFKNRYRLSGRGAMAHVQAPNQLWMIDASPVDMLCLDGRHNVYVAIDIFTRRMVAYVTRTPRAEGVALLMRRAILAWGVPEEVKTDNGSDFVAHATRRLFAAIGIRRVTAEAFSPEQKGHVERAIGTFQRGFVRLLPGFIGHSVADRKVIEARKSFAARLGEDPREALCVELSAAELQRYADAWIASKYEHRPHEGLGGVTPFQAAAASTAPILTVEERALDMLLAPVAGQHGLRLATKSGIRIDGFHYLAPQILPETQVMVRMDPADMGRAFLFDPAGVTYLGEAVCPELAGIDPKAAVAAAKAEQARIIAERTADVRKEAKRLTKGPRLIDLALRHSARQAGTLVDFPKAREVHTTPALEAAALAAAPRTAPKPRISDETRALQARLAAEGGAPAGSGAQVRPLHAVETPKLRWTRAQALERRLAAGEALAPEETTWLLGYAQGPEYKGFKLTFGDAHDVAARQAPVEAG